MPPPRCPWATRPINVCCLKRLPLVRGVEGAVVERVIFKRRNPGAAEVFILSIAICQLRTHAKHTRVPTPALRRHVKDAREGRGGGRGGGRNAGCGGGRAWRRGGRIVICQRRKHHHHSRGLPPTAPIPTPQRLLHQRFLHRRTLFERPKPFVGATGPVAVAVDT